VRFLPIFVETEVHFGPFFVSTHFFVWVGVKEKIFVSLLRLLRIEEKILYGYFSLSHLVGGVGSEITFVFMVGRPFCPLGFGTQ